MIISQNVSSQAQVKNFLFHRNVLYRSEDIQIFVFLTSYDLPNLLIITSR